MRFRFQAFGMFAMGVVLLGWLPLVDAARKSGLPSLEVLLEAVARCAVPSATSCEVLKQAVARAADDPDQLLPFLSSEDTDTRIGASAALGYVGKKEHLKVVEQRLEVENSAAVKEPLLSAVGRLGFIEGLPMLEKFANRGIGDRIMAANAIAQLGHPEGVPVLLAQLSHPHPKVQSAALVALAKLMDSRAVEPVMDALGSGKMAWTTEIHAIHALGELKVSEAGPLLLLRLSHPEPDVRRRAARVLGLLKISYAVPALVQRSEDTEIAGDVAIAIATIGDARAVPDLNWAAMNPDLSEGSRRQVFWALGMLQDARSVPPLVELCRSRDLSLVLLAAETLGRLGQNSGAGVLLGLMEHERDEIRAMAEWSLKQISGQDFGEDYGAWEGWIQAHAPPVMPSKGTRGATPR